MNKNSFVSLLSLSLALLFQNACSKSNVESVIWDTPIVESNAHNDFWDPELRLTRVELNSRETVIDLTVYGFSEDGYLFSFQPRLCLKAGDAVYALDSIEGMKPGELIKTPIDTEEKHLVFHFKPMPLDTRQFDFIEGNSPSDWNIYGIHNFDPNSDVLFKSHWRDARSGDWIISFHDDFAIAENQVWKYASKPDGTSGQVILERDGEQLEVEVSPIRNGSRKIKVGSKRYTCVRFDTDKFPDYPRKDRSRFKDNGFRDGDSVTINGIILNSAVSTCSVLYDDLYGTDSYPKFAGTVNPDGTFHVKFPVRNSQSIRLQVEGGYFSRGCTFDIPVEPAEEYFIYCDRSRGQKMVMGPNARVVNEYLSYGHYIRFESLIDMAPDKTVDAESYLEYLEMRRSQGERILDSIAALHPTLSRKFRVLDKVFLKWELAADLGQSRFRLDNRGGNPVLPANLSEFAHREIWNSNPICVPLPLFNLSHFMRNYLQSCEGEWNNSDNLDMVAIIKKGRERGKISMTDADLDAVSSYMDAVTRIATELDSIRRADNVPLDKLNDLSLSLTEKHKDVIEKGSEVIKRYENEFKAFSDELSDEQKIEDFKTRVAIIDSLGGDKLMRQIAITKSCMQIMDWGKHSLAAPIKEIFDREVKIEAAVNVVNAMHDKYLALENVDIAALGSIRDAKSLAGMSDGEKILAEIVRPFEGKIVWIDVWGSWCHPCLENLSHAAEVRKALEDYDIVYLYLANNTTDEAMKSIIAEYGLSGDNIVHYNLPAIQQNAVENYLNVSAYPSYRLINRHGALLDVQASPHDLMALKKVLDKL